MLACPPPSPLRATDCGASPRTLGGDLYWDWGFIRGDPSQFVKLCTIFFVLLLDEIFTGGAITARAQNQLREKMIILS